MDKIKSLAGKRVRIKREYIKYTADWYPTIYLDDDVPFSCFFETCHYDDCHSRNPLTWTGVVKAHVFGVTMMPCIDGDCLSDYKPTHQIVLNTIGDLHDCTIWDIKYFEVVIAKEVVTTEWVVDEEFNNL
jgi:hypothetical protein